MSDSIFDNQSNTSDTITYEIYNNDFSDPGDVYSNSSDEDKVLTTLEPDLYVNSNISNTETNSNKYIVSKKTLNNKKCILQFVNKYWKDLKQTKGEGWIYVTKSLETKHPLFLYFKDKMYLKQFLIENWYWSKSAHIICLNKKKNKLKNRIYLSYTLDEEYEATNVIIYLSKKKMRDNYGKNKNNIHLTLKENKKNIIPDKVRNKYTKNKTNEDLLNKYRLKGKGLVII